MTANDHLPHEVVVSLQNDQYTTILLLVLDSSLQGLETAEQTKGNQPPLTESKLEDDL